MGRTKSLGLLACVPLLMVGLQPPAFAESGAAGDGATGCAAQKKKKSGFGGIAKKFGAQVFSNVATNTLSKAGVPTGVAGVYLPVNSLLTDAIMKKLDCKEQVQAATATNTAVRGGVGTTATWKSETRPGVSGRSTARAKTASASGSNCMMITDVIIVDGEETTVDKQMCQSRDGNYVVAV